MQDVICTIKKYISCSLELKNYVLDIISHQITDTIDKEEEMEAWREIADFFGEEFERILLEIMMIKF